MNEDFMFSVSCKTLSKFLLCILLGGGGEEQNKGGFYFFCKNV